MKQIRIDSVLVTLLLCGSLSTQSVSALRCYKCESSSSWSDCQSGASVVECSSISEMSLMGRSLFLPAQARQLEPACVSVYAKASSGGVSGSAYVRDCLFNDKALCSVIQDALPAPIRIVDCDLCTTELCNGASSISAVTLSSVVMMAIAVLLWK